MNDTEIKKDLGTNFQNSSVSEIDKLSPLLYEAISSTFSGAEKARFDKNKIYIPKRDEISHDMWIEITELNHENQGTKETLPNKSGSYAVIEISTPYFPSNRFGLDSDLNIMDYTKVFKALGFDEYISASSGENAASDNWFTPFDNKYNSEGRMIKELAGFNVAVSSTSLITNINKIIASQSNDSEQKHGALNIT